MAATTSSVTGTANGAPAGRPYIARSDQSAQRSARLPGSYTTIKSEPTLLASSASRGDSGLERHARLWRASRRPASESPTGETRFRIRSSKSEALGETSECSNGATSAKDASGRRWQMMERSRSRQGRGGGPRRPTTRSVIVQAIGSRRRPHRPRPTRADSVRTRDEQPLVPQSDGRQADRRRGLRTSADTRSRLHQLRSDGAVLVLAPSPKPLDVRAFVAVLVDGRGQGWS